MPNEGKALVFRSKRFTTPKVRAVFPSLNQPDKYSKYTVAVDLLENPELEAALVEQAKETLVAAQEKLETKKKPANLTGFIKIGEYQDKPTRRVRFEMASERKVKGEIVKQRPMLVDAKLNPLPSNTAIWGGSLIRVSYQMKFSISNFGVHVKPTLVAVQVLELVGPGGEVRANDLFDEEEGGFVVSEDAGGDDFESEGGEDTEPAAPGAIKNGKDF